jgi:hypothetical protein
MATKEYKDDYKKRKNGYSFVPSIFFHIFKRGCKPVEFVYYDRYGVFDRYGVQLLYNLRLVLDKNSVRSRDNLAL